MVYTALMSYASEILAWICILLTWVGLITCSVMSWLQRTTVME